MTAGSVLGRQRTRAPYAPSAPAGTSTPVTIMSAHSARHTARIRRCTHQGSFQRKNAGGSVRARTTRATFALARVQRCPRARRASRRPLCDRGGEPRAGAANELALALEGRGALRIGERKPADRIHLRIAVAEASATPAHEKEPDALEDAHRASLGVAPYEPVRDVAESL